MSLLIDEVKGIAKGSCKVSELRKVGMVKASIECQAWNDREENFRQPKAFKTG
jgi:hypothetical protein